jgi:hypothetical protein
MDILCVRCGEPWDTDELHYAAEESGRTWSEVRADFYARGCMALDGGQRCERIVNPSTTAAYALYELLGDDVDGAASMLEDLGLS